MGHKRNTDKLYSVDKVLHEQIVQDLLKKDSKILTKLLKSFEETSRDTVNGEVFIGQVLPFMKPRKETRLEPSNARTVIKNTIHTKMRNIRKASSQKDTCSTSSFKISEILEYCNLLEINPAEILMNSNIQPFLLPLKYCDAKEIHAWLNQAKTKPQIDEPVRIPFRSAPIIGVYLDVYFSANETKTLDEMIPSSEPIEVSETEKNRVQMQAFLTVKTDSTSTSFRPVVMKIRDFSLNSKKNTKIDDYLSDAQRYFYCMCQIRYEEERKYIESLTHFSTENTVSQYYSEIFSASFESYLQDRLTKGADTPAYPKSSLARVKNEYEEAQKGR